MMCNFPENFSEYGIYAIAAYLSSYLKIIGAFISFWF